MDLKHEFHIWSGVDLDSIGWTIGRHNKTFIDTNSKTIWVGTFDDLIQLEYHLLFKYPVAVRQAFHLVGSQYEIKEDAMEIFTAANPSWKHTTVGSFLVLRNELDHKVIVLDPTTNDDPVSTHLAHNIHAMSDLADISRIGVLQSSSISLPTITVDGVVLYPNIIRDYSKRIIESWSLVKATDTEIIIRGDKVHYERISRTMVKKTNEFRFMLDGKKVVNSREELAPSPWMEAVKGEYDFAPNPNNRQVWDKIGATVMYDSNRLLINDAEEVFINTQFGWLMSEHTWIEESDQVSQELKDEYAMAKNIMNMK